MEKITGNEQAYPYYDKDGSISGIGLTIRQHFAGLAMQAILSNRKLQECLIADAKHYGTNHENMIAFHAVREADALIAELNKPTP